MNREDIICMAQEAGFDYSGTELTWESVICTEELEAFAALVASHALVEPCCCNYDQCQKVCMPRAASAEREACAKIAETPIGEYEVVVACGTEPTPSRIPQYANWQDIAKVIRARGQA